MKSKIFQSSMAIFLLLLFTSTKIIGIHEMLHDHQDHASHHSHDHVSGLYGHIDQDSHDHDQPQNDEDQKEDCDFCDKIVLDNLSAYDGSEISVSTETPNHFYNNVITEYSSEIHTTDLSTDLFSRPPPVLG